MLSKLVADKQAPVFTRIAFMPAFMAPQALNQNKLPLCAASLLEPEEIDASKGAKKSQVTCQDPFSHVRLEHRQ